jgi:hypothetical protein
MIPYLVRLLDIMMNNNIIPGNWNKAIVVPIYKVVGNYRPVSLTSVVCKQIKHVIAGYLTQVLEMCGWLYDGQHGFRPGHSCKSQVVTVCQDIADSLDKGVGAHVIITDFSKAFDLLPCNRLVTKMATTSVDLRAVV